MMFEDYSLPMGPIFKDFRQFNKYIFEFIYALSCLNQYGMIHGDLHLNNCTIFELKVLIGRDSKKPIIPNPHMIYEAGGVQYIFPTSGRTVALIDFSRAFIWDREILSKDYNENQIKTYQTHYKTRMLDVMKFEFLISGHIKMTLNSPLNVISMMYIRFSKLLIHGRLCLAGKFFCKVSSIIPNKWQLTEIVR